MDKKGRKNWGRTERNRNSSQKTSWGNVADWYDQHLSEADTYHAKVIMPNLLRLINLKPDESLLELGCGQGFFLEKLSTFSKNLTGVDVSGELIALAKRKNSQINYLVASAGDETILLGKTFDVITVILALQNIKNLPAVARNLSRLLKETGRIYIVLNHPAFRIPQHSDWIYDDKKKIQSRKVDLYLSQVEIPINMNPGQTARRFDEKSPVRSSENKMTWSFHRSLQDYSKIFAKNSLVISKIEEWISHKKSEPGQRSRAEDSARREFPLFMCLELKKLK
ncbi:MAG TPA: class I SAM-dependent methyltransferase [Candidatus Paceibacterota bacterium]|nr:class I SAM-dependent methyltransferase [Candidatus Paceibacterota bacterium]HRZ34577.1 class I SAM-dependent methyltransferase [Candidatus Paceibacterota bacterium]